MARCLRAAPLLFALITAGTAAEVIPPAPNAHFNDYAGLVRPAIVQALDEKLAQFERATSNQVVVAVFPQMQSDSSIEDYTVRVAQAWHVGQKGRDNGAVLFVFAQDHTAYIQVGYGLEGALPDATCKRIIENELVPNFRRGNYGAGLASAVDAIIAATRGEYHGTGRTTADRSARGGPPIIVFAAFILLIVFSVISSFRRHVLYQGAGRRGFWAGGGPWIFPGGGGFGGGGGGGGFSGGGGGFSGGGGSFGGGGAGGSW